jgi:hypothetical protein
MGKAIMKRGRARSLEPTSYSEAVAFADQIAGTSFVPAHFRGKPAEILAAMQYGAELGLGPLQSLNGLAVINGKVSMLNATMRALVEASGLMEKCSVNFVKDPPLATVVVRRVGREDATFSFGFDDARSAGLADRPMYQKYPERMYMARAMSFALRDEFADVLGGIMGAEEMDEKGEFVTESGELADTPTTSDTKERESEKMLSAFSPELGGKIRSGFEYMELNEAKRIVMLKEFDGRGDDLYKRLGKNFLEAANGLRPPERISLKDSTDVSDANETGMDVEDG